MSRHTHIIHTAFTSHGNKTIITSTICIHMCVCVCVYVCEFVSVHACVRVCACLFVLLYFQKNININTLARTVVCKLKVIWKHTNSKTHKN